MPTTRPREFVEALADELRGGGYATAVVGSDASLLAISRHRDLLEGAFTARLGLPSAEAVEAASDKIRFLDAADVAGLSCPLTVVCADAAQALAAAEQIGYPVVLKPQCSVYESQGRMRREASRRIADARDLTGELPRYGSPCLVQRVEPGAVHSCSGVYAAGRLLAFSFARYIRTWPAQAGNAALSETAVAPRGLDAKVVRLLDALGWEGIFELELVQRGDGVLAAIDFNPRPYGSLELAIRSGADLPAIWVGWVLGVDSEPAVARPGRRYRWEDAELRRLWSDLRGGRIGDVARVARPQRRVVHAQFRWDDPGPLLARAAYLATRARTRLRGTRGR
ncbi:MAG TPA: hypothetical protein VHE14_00200 [Solirubrobacteraceae bacterium]|nr:hypothetical protein [Solirubrobacteraceae bacterium]